VLGLSPGILILALGIVAATVALTIPLNYQSYGIRGGGSFTVPVNLILFLVAMVLWIFGAIILYGERESLRQVEWKKEGQTQETETN
jgi:hypothetical protein